MPSLSNRKATMKCNDIDCLFCYLGNWDPHSPSTTTTKTLPPLIAFSTTSEMLPFSHSMAPFHAKIPNMTFALYEMRRVDKDETKIMVIET